jgi:hypothetical protein
LSDDPICHELGRSKTPESCRPCHTPVASHRYAAPGSHSAQHPPPPSGDSTLLKLSVWRCLSRGFLGARDRGCHSGSIVILEVLFSG